MIQMSQPKQRVSVSPANPDERIPFSKGLKRREVVETLIAVVGLALGLFHLYTAYFGALSPMYQRFTHLSGALILGLLAYGPMKGKQSRLSAWVTGILLVLMFAVSVFFFSRLSASAIINRGIWGPSTLEIWAGVLLVLLVLEVTRRTVGLPIVIVAVAFIAYAFLGPYLPTAIAHRGYTLERLVTSLVWTNEGIFGVPISVSASYVALFILFGAFLESLGGASFFLDLATALAGHRKGGPAQVAVVSSALMGTISGSAVANVVTTGAFTIPLMKRIGYPPAFAAAVEAVASTGGQIMPPVMGAAAFVMSEMTEIPYWQIVVAALLPGLMYFASVAIMVYLRADRLGLKGMDKSELPKVKDVWAKGFHLMIPLAVLIYLLLVLKQSPTRAGIYTIIALLAVSIAEIGIRQRRFPYREIISAIISGAKTMAPVASACATAGIVIGVVSLTGLGVRFSQMILSLAGGNLALTLFFTMLACIILGMGLPTTASYIITAVLGVPALTKLGIPLLSAHLFIFYFACLSFITPPVALAAYAASGISGANAMTTGFAAWKLGIAGFITPFMFVYSPELLLQGPWAQIILVVITSVLGVIALSAAVEGWLKGRLGPISRVVLFGAALLLIKPGLGTDLLGIALLAGVYAIQLRSARSRSLVA